MTNIKFITMILLMMLANIASASERVSVGGGKGGDIGTGESLVFAKVRINDTSRIFTVNQDGLPAVLGVSVGLGQAKKLVVGLSLCKAILNEALL